MSLWTNYLKERLGYDAVETEAGFITYRIKGAVCEIFDIYVAPEFRRGRKGWTLVDEVVATAKQQNCTLLMGYIWAGINGASESMSAHLAYGFKIYTADGGKITMTKDIGG